MTKLTPALLLVLFAAASAAQEPPPKPSGPHVEVEELSRLLVQQKELLEAQARELESLKKRLSEVEALALSSHNRFQELEEQPEQETVAVAVERRLAELEQQVEKIPETPANVVEAGEFPGSVRIPGTNAAMKVGGQVRLSVVKTRGRSVSMTSSSAPRSPSKEPRRRGRDRGSCTPRGQAV
jgi:hypothetical protein